MRAENRAQGSARSALVSVLNRPGLVRCSCRSDADIESTNKRISVHRHVTWEEESIHVTPFDLFDTVPLHALYQRREHDSFMKATVSEIGRSWTILHDLDDALDIVSPCC